MQEESTTRNRIKGLVVLLLVFVVPLGLAIATLIFARPATNEALEGMRETQDACYQAALDEVGSSATVEPPRELGSTGQWAGRLEYDDGRRAMYRCHPDGAAYTVIIAEH